MEKIYNRNGMFFGYVKKSHLYTYSGKCVGKFFEDEIYGNDGKYLGEINRFNYLARIDSKKNKKIEVWFPEDGEKIRPLPPQFGLIGSASIKFVDFKDVDEF